MLGLGNQSEDKDLERFASIMSPILTGQSNGYRIVKLHAALTAVAFALLFRPMHERAANIKYVCWWRL
jgi:hypothetical protein